MQAVEEDDVEAMEEAVDTVKEGKVLPDIDTLNNLLMCVRSLNAQRCHR